MFRRSIRNAGLVWRNLLIVIVMVSGLGVAAIPLVNQDANDQKRQEIVRTLAHITMAKTAYAVDKDLIDGSKVTIDQIVGKTPYLKTTPTYPLKGELLIGRIGESPRFKLEDGTIIDAVIKVNSKEIVPE